MSQCKSDRLFQLAQQTKASFSRRRKLAKESGTPDAADRTKQRRSRDLHPKTALPFRAIGESLSAYLQADLSIGLFRETVKQIAESLVSDDGKNNILYQDLYQDTLSPVPVPQSVQSFGTAYSFFTSILLTVAVLHCILVSVRSNKDRITQVVSASTGGNEHNDTENRHHIHETAE